MRWDKESGGKEAEGASEGDGYVAALQGLTVSGDLKEKVIDLMVRVGLAAGFDEY